MSKTSKEKGRERRGRCQAEGIRAALAQRSTRCQSVWDEWGLGAAAEAPWKRAGITTDKETRDAVTALHPIGRLGTAGEIADAVVWLASNRSSFVTGHSLLVDGGYIAH